MPSEKNVLSGYGYIPVKMLILSCPHTDVSAVTTRLSQKRVCVCVRALTWMTEHECVLQVRMRVCIVCMFKPFHNK